MNGKQLNENIIKLELQGICQDCIYLNRVVPIIREMLLEEYKTGLEQSSFDKNMLERDNQELKTLNKRYKEIISDDEENYKLLSSEIKELKNQQKEFIEWLENESKEIIGVSNEKDTIH